tara:strand:- start:706 stop:876 length:171 start_codon:yes stop_codon:yes gene_type:complete
MNDIKMYVANVLSFIAVQFTSIDKYLSIILLIATTGYTIHRWILLIKKGINDRKEK